MLLLAFVFSVFVQVNDPDAAPWMAIYGAAALACVLAFWNRAGTFFPATVAILAGAWAATLAPGVIAQVPFLEMFSAWEMRDTGVEESREMYGLVIVAVWMAVIARGVPRAKSRGPSQD